MNDDWRVRIDLHDHGFAHRLGESLQAEELESDLRRSFADRVVISVDGSEMFLYAADRTQAEAAQQVVGRISAEHGWKLDTELRRWHSVAEIWEDPENPEPTTESQERTEEQIRIAGERRDSAEEGYPEFEVRVTCDSRHDAVALSERLDGEGIANVHRWSWVLVGASDEESGQAIAERLRGELPGAEITVETNLRTVWKNQPGNPVAWLGGLAG
jgi:hypothetical protein